MTITLDSSHGLIFMHDDDFIIGSDGDGPFFFAVDDYIGKRCTAGSFEVAIADH